MNTKSHHPMLSSVLLSFLQAFILLDHFTLLQTELMLAGMLLQMFVASDDFCYTFHCHALRVTFHMAVWIFLQGRSRIFVLPFGKNSNLGAQRIHSYRRKNDNLICL